MTDRKRQHFDFSGIANDILSSLDKGQAVLLVLLDLSAAFDTLDSDIMVERLEKRCGVTGNAVSWFGDYLRNRQQRVIIDKVESDLCDLKYCVPQGSVLGPILFMCYVLPLGDILRQHNMQFHFYAEVPQLYMFTNSACTPSPAVLECWILHVTIIYHRP